MWVDTVLLELTVLHWNISDSVADDHNYDKKVKSLCAYSILGLVI